MKKTSTPSWLLDAIGINQDRLNDIAFETELFKRIRLLTPTSLLFSILNESMKGTTSYNDLASSIESEDDVSVSKQAVWKKVKEPCKKFFMEIMELVISNKINSSEIKMKHWSSNYKRVLVQDSTIVKLPTRLYEIFSGVSNGHSKVCNARIQCTYDILAEQFVSFSIDPYNKNDLKAAPEIILQEGDLVLRDRGYMILDEIQRHIEHGAQCIFRHKFGMTLLDPKTEQPINILELLKKNINLDMEVMLNNESKTIVRLIGMPVNTKIANSRRAKAKRENKTTPSKEYLTLLGWSIYITTIPVDQSSHLKIFELYSLRWRIEIIFKSWKSNMAFDKIHNVSNIQLHVLLLARFIMIVVSTQNIYYRCKMIIKKHCGKQLSLMKFTHYLFRYPKKIPILFHEVNKYKHEIGKNISAIARYCSYDKRRNRQNHEQQMNNLFCLS